MKIIHSLEEMNIKEPIVFAIGFFDGIHKGHQEILNQTKKLAAKKSTKSGIITFYPHPLSVIFPENPVKLLLTQTEKYEILKKYNLDIIIEIKPDIEFLHQSHEEFLNKLKKFSNLKGIIVGENFTFGYKGSGNAETMKKFFKNEVEVKKINLIKNTLTDNTVISSTNIRKFIADGNMREAMKFLGRPYFITDKIVHGFKRGSELLGIPTANLEYGFERMLPSDGVYATYIEVKGNKHPSITNIGTNPTFNDKERTIETFILDFDEEIYGQTVKLEWIEKIRDEIKFEKYQYLILQIKKDIKKAEEILKRPNN